MFSQLETVSHNPYKITHQNSTKKFHQIIFHYLHLSQWDNHKNADPSLLANATHKHLSIATGVK